MKIVQINLGYNKCAKVKGPWGMTISSHYELGASRSWLVFTLNTGKILISFKYLDICQIRDNIVKQPNRICWQRLSYCCHMTWAWCSCQLFCDMLSISPNIIGQIYHVCSTPTPFQYGPISSTWFMFAPTTDKLCLIWPVTF